MSKKEETMVTSVTPDVCMKRLINADAGNKEDLKWLKNVIGFETVENNGKVQVVDLSDTSLKAVISACIKYDLDPLIGEIYSMFGKPYPSYKGLHKIVRRAYHKAGIHHKIDFKVVEVKKDYASYECRLFALPQQYGTDIKKYYEDMLSIGLTYQEAKEEATTIGYGEKSINDIKSSKMRPYFKLMAKKDAFRDLVNFLDIPDMTQEIPINFAEDQVFNNDGEIIEGTVVEPEKIASPKQIAQSKQLPAHKKQLPAHEQIIADAFSDFLNVIKNNSKITASVKNLLKDKKFKKTLIKNIWQKDDWKELEVKTIETVSEALSSDDVSLIKEINELATKPKPKKDEEPLL